MSEQAIRQPVRGRPSTFSAAWRRAVWRQYRLERRMFWRDPKRQNMRRSSRYCTPDRVTPPSRDISAAPERAAGIACSLMPRHRRRLVRQRLR